jgi:hypothetical protein
MNKPGISQGLRGITALLAVVTVLLIGFGLTGCGGSDFKTDTPPPVDEPPVVETPSSPVAGTDGSDESGDTATALSDAERDALVQTLLPPDSEITQSTSEAVHIETLTDYPDAIVWYDENLPKLGFTNTLSEEDLALLNAGSEAHIYKGMIDGQPINIYVQDWSNTYGNGDMSLIMISFD